MDQVGRRQARLLEAGCIEIVATAYPQHRSAGMGGLSRGDACQEQRCCGIVDPVLERTILITSTGSRSTVVWNPWVEKADKMGDFGPDGYLNMVCVETANAAEDVISLVAGETHSMTAQYRVIATTG